MTPIRTDIPARLDRLPWSAFSRGWLSAGTQALGWSAIFFVASAAASAAYLTVSEVFPLEMRAISISLFYAAGTALGGFAGPPLYGAMSHRLSRRRRRAPAARAGVHAARLRSAPARRRLTVCQRAGIPWAASHCRLQAVGPPFRADHVGSLLRPPELKQARENFKNKKIPYENLKDIEDRAIRKAVAMQEAAGLRSVTDGEFRRAFWHVDFLTGFEGIVATQGQYALKFHGEGGAESETRSMMVVNGKVRRTKPVAVEHFKFLKRTTTKTAKLCIPAPTYLHMRGGRKMIDAAAYPDVEEFWSDIARAYREEIAELAAAGCGYLQIDDVSFACLCDEGIRAQVRRDGEDPAKLPAKYASVISALLRNKPKDMGVTMHTCRGNHASMWMASGGYEAVAEAAFQTEVDGFFLEYDTARAGGFEPLRFVPKGKKVVLGLVSTKKPQLEDKAALRRRIEEASKYVALEDLCLSPQCGFASSEVGNRLTEDDQRRKLELVVEVAAEVWG